MSTMIPAAVRAWPGWPAVWTRCKQLAPWALALLVLALLARQAGTIAWRDVGSALLQQSPLMLAAAAALALVSHALFASYDLVSRHETGHRLSAPRTLGIAAVCYAFNLNFGSLVGALAVKLRLYARAGLKPALVARIIAVAVLTNWVGYLALGGLVLAIAPPPVPPQIELSSAAVRAIGIAMLGVAVAYAVMCVVRRGRPFTVRGHRLAPPLPRVVAWQFMVSITNWALMGVIVWLLLGRAAPYTMVLAVLLLAAVAGVATHVPAGLGVVEAVFVACLGGQGNLTTTTVLAALLSYRAVYYLVPLALASIGYAFSEASARKSGRAPAGTSRARGSTAARRT